MRQGVLISYRGCSIIAFHLALGGLVASQRMEGWLVATMRPAEAFPRLVQ
jgi:hypothetical protein